MKGLYLVTFNGYTHGYGAYYSVLGIYTSEEKAEEAIKNAAAENGLDYDDVCRRTVITKLKLDKSYLITEDSWRGYVTAKAIGGYME